MWHGCEPEGGDIKQVVHSPYAFHANVPGMNDALVSRNSGALHTFLEYWDNIFLLNLAREGAVPQPGTVYLVYTSLMYYSGELPQFLGIYVHIRKPTIQRKFIRIFRSPMSYRGNEGACKYYRVMTDVANLDRAVKRGR